MFPAQQHSSCKQEKRIRVVVRQIYMLCLLLCKQTGSTTIREAVHSKTIKCDIQRTTGLDWVAEQETSMYSLVSICICVTPCCFYYDLEMPTHQHDLHACFLSRNCLMDQRHDIVVVAIFKRDQTRAFFLYIGLH